jgi:hypothetical protein
MTCFGSRSEEMKISHRAITAVVSVLVAIVLTVGVAVAARGSVQQSGERSSSGPLVGHVWTVISVGADARVPPSPADGGATIAFAPDGRLAINDGVNYLSGHYALTPGGFRVYDLTSTLAAYAGHDPAVIGTIDALRTLTSATVTVTGPAAAIVLGRYHLGLARRETYDPAPASTPASTTP